MRLVKSPQASEDRVALNALKVPFETVNVPKGTFEASLRSTPSRSLRVAGTCHA